MEKKKTPDTSAAPAPTTEGAARIGKRFSGALVEGSRASLNGMVDLGRTLLGFGRELLDESTRHIRDSLNAKNLRELGELQAAWLQHRIETSAAHAKEVADLARARSIEAITPFAPLQKQEEAA